MVLETTLCFQTRLVSPAPPYPDSNFPINSDLGSSKGPSGRGAGGNRLSGRLSLNSLDKQRKVILIQTKTIRYNSRNTLLSQTLMKPMI